MKKDKVFFEFNDAIHIFNKFKNFYDEESVKNWSKQVVKDINEIFANYNVLDYKLNKNSYMGIVLDCMTCDKDIYIKIVPPMIERFNREVGTLKRLPMNVTCSIIEIIDSKNAIIMEKILPGTLATFNDNQKDYFELFEILNKNKIKITEEIENDFSDFYDVVKHDYTILKKYNFSTDFVEKLYTQFCEKYGELGNEKYLLHGDIYKNNALKSENGIKIIDPLGFKAPFVFELLPICAYEMFYADGDYQIIMDNFATFFNKYVTKEVYERAMFCQLVKVYIPSIFEANDGGVRANKWLDIIKTLYPQYLV